MVRSTNKSPKKINMNKDFAEQTPLISVILPTYNRAHLMPRAVQSVLNQTYKNFELIIVDDGSNDHTPEIAKAFNDQRIVYVRHKENKGVTASYNTGLRLARGKYVAFLGDDDELLSDALKTVINKFDEISLKTGEVGCLFFDCIKAETGETAGLGLRKGFISYRDWLCGVVRGNYWGVINRQEISPDELKFDENVYANEIIFWLKLLRKYRFYYIPLPLYIAYGKHGGERLSEFRTILKHLPKAVQGMKILLEEFGREMENLCPKHYGECLKSLGLYLLLDNNISEGREILRRSLLYKFSIESLVLLIMSHILSSKQLSLVITEFSEIKNKLRSIINSRCIFSMW